jgi:hypothetical protein
LICSECKIRVHEFYDFKKQCDLNTEILLQVKDELDKMQIISEDKLESDEAVEQDLFEDSYEQAEIDEEVAEEQESSPLVKRTKAAKKAKKGYKEAQKKGSQCSICGKIVKGIQMHMLIHAGLKKHSCQYCQKTFTQSGQLKRHINSHLNIRNYECPVSGCDRTFVDPSSVTKHLVVHNKEDRKFQCSLCGSRFNRLGALRYHEKTHRQERNHHCNICNKSFLGMLSLVGFELDSDVGFDSS